MENKCKTWKDKKHSVDLRVERSCIFAWGVRSSPQWEDEGWMAEQDKCLAEEDSKEPAQRRWTARCAPGRPRSSEGRQRSCSREGAGERARRADRRVGGYQTLKTLQSLRRVSAPQQCNSTEAFTGSYSRLWRTHSGRINIDKSPEFMTDTLGQMRQKQYKRS